MGLLEQFGNLNPEQAQGLLAAASQILQQSGDPRRPYGLGQAMGAGIESYQASTEQAKRRKQQEEQFAQMQQMHGLQIKGLESDQAIKDQQRQRMERIRTALTTGTQTGPATAPASVQQPLIAPSPADPSWMTAYRQQQPAAASGTPARQDAGTTQALIDRLTQAAQVYAAEGDIEGSTKMLEQAAKFRAKFSTTPQVMRGANGQPINVLVNDEGYTKEMPYGVAEKLHFQDTGGGYAGLDQYTGEVRASGKKTQSADSIANNAVSIRGQNLTDARQRDANEIARTDKKKTLDQATAGQVASFDTMLGTLDRLSTHPGLSKSVGIYSKVPTMPGSDSANFQAELETFKSQAFIPMVAQLKGMGALSDAEGKKLTAAVGALDPRMGEPAFRASVKRVTDDMTKARARVSGQPAGGTRTVVKTGTYGGRKVVQYSDGSTEYAD